MLYTENAPVQMMKALFPAEFETQTCQVVSGGTPEHKTT